MVALSDGASQPLLKLCVATERGDEGLELEAYRELAAIYPDGSAERTFWARVADQFVAGKRRLDEFDALQQQADEQEARERSQRRCQEQKQACALDQPLVEPSEANTPPVMAAGVQCRHAKQSRQTSADASCSESIGDSHSHRILAGPMQGQQPGIRSSVAETSLAACPVNSTAYVARAPERATLPGDAEEETSSSADQAFEEEFRCTVCLDLLFEPSTTACGHTFCRPCLLRATASKSSCPLCRKDLGLEMPSISTLLWNTIQQRMPARCEARRAQVIAMAAERARLAAETVDGAPRPATDAELVAERRRQQELQAILEMSLRHRDRLVRANPHLNYFQRLQQEFDTGAFFRCRCPERFVCIRFRINGDSRHRGRTAVGCPLVTADARRDGCGFFEIIG